MTPATSDPDIENKDEATSTGNNDEIASRMYWTHFQKRNVRKESRTD